MTDPDDCPADMVRVRKACEALIEHFDSVQIFATRHEPGEKDGTVTIRYGLGNWYTRYGHVKEWVIKEEETTRESVRRDE